MLKLKKLWYYGKVPFDAAFIFMMNRMANIPVSIGESWNTSAMMAKMKVCMLNGPHNNFTRLLKDVEKENI